MRIIPRREIGLNPVVKNINRITNRPRLARGLGLILCHYTGTNVKYAGKDPIPVIKSIDRWKANEYNYVISQDGRVWEFAGEFQAAHCKGFNETAYGVLFLNGVGEPCTDAQVEAFNWLKGCLEWVGAVQVNPWVLGHFQVAATACPGETKLRLHELS